MMLDESSQGLGQQETPNHESDAPQSTKFTIFQSMLSDSDEENQSIPFDFVQENEQVQLQQQDERSYHLHSINSTIVIRQLPSQGLSFQLWPAAATLVTLLDGRHTFPLLLPLLPDIRQKRLRILELGSGTGVVGIAAAALLAADVTATDLPHVLPNMKHNVDANAGIVELGSGEVSLAPLSWGEDRDMDAIGREYDMIVASDVVYHDHLYEPLIQTLKYFLLGSGKETVFLMGHLRRWKKESAFFKKANKLFDVKVIHSDSPCNGCRVGVKVYLFVRKGGENIPKLNISLDS